MTPSNPSLGMTTLRPCRRALLKMAFTGVFSAGLGSAVGCTGLAIRPQSPDEANKKSSDVRLVSDLAVPTGMYPIKIEAVGLVTGLPGTGSDPPPSPQRAALLDDMQKRGVTYPNQVLASTTTELVVVRALLRPGIQKGDRFDVEVRVPSKSDCTSLRGGWLMEARLKELAVLESRVREGGLWALAEGAILVDPAADGDADRVKLTRGRILGGGIALKSRQLGLVLKPEHRTIAASARIGTAVNRRFHTFNSGVKQGMANPKTDEYIDLTVHPRYKDNIERYVQVVRNLPVRESASEQLARVALLERQLLDPVTAGDAALRLEALGKDGVKALSKGLAADEELVRFYAAEALAYLDEHEAIEPLAAAARNVPAFRAYALAALSAMDDAGAYEALRELLDVSSAETRYGAFRALWAMDSLDALVRGENIGNQFSYHVLETKGQPMIHVTRSYRPEVVLFGHDQRLSPPFVLEAGKKIMIKSTEGEEVTVSRFGVDEPDQKRVVSNRVDEIVRTVVELGGTYPDVVQALQHAKASKALASRFEIDALPSGGRTYEIEDDGDETGDKSEDGTKRRGVVVANPLPELFGVRDPKDPEVKAKDKTAKDKPAKDKTAKKKTGTSGRKSASSRRLFDKIARRNS